MNVEQAPQNQAATVVSHQARTSKVDNNTGKVLSVSKIYTHVNKIRPRAYHDYENFEIQWNKTDGYEIVTKIGRGKYSEVFDGYDTRANERGKAANSTGIAAGENEKPNKDGEKKIIIKVLKPVRSGKIKREVKILSNLKGGPNIVKLLDTCKAGNEHSCFMALIFEHIEHENVKDLMLQFDNLDCKYYMYQLLKALDYCHMNGIMHRDVKPQNLVIDHRNRQLRLIDWGLADFYHPGQTYNVRVASRHYKSPELLVNMRMYDYSVDLFAFGCTVLGIVTGKIPFFRGKDNVDQLFKIADVLGTVDLKAYLTRYNLRLNKHFHPLLVKVTTRIPWTKYIPSRRKSFSKQEGIFELLDGVLLYDHQERLTAKECMGLKYFNEVRQSSENY